MAKLPKTAAIASGPHAPTPPGVVTGVLPDGRAYAIRRAKGRDAVAASRLGAKTEAEGGFALLAQVVTIDGKRVAYEDLLDMDLGPVSILLDVMQGNL